MTILDSDLDEVKVATPTPVIPIVKGPLCLPGMIDGIDVSSVQGAIDFGRVKAAGFDFVAVKVAEGKSGHDPSGVSNLMKARAAGLETLAYLFCRLGDSAVDDVQNLWSAVGAVMPGRFVLDVETAPDDMGAQAILDWVSTAVDAVGKLTALPPVIYTGPGFWSRLGAALNKPSVDDIANECPLWVAQYRSTTRAWAPAAGDHPVVPRPWNLWSMWQYSGNGGYRVDGVRGDVDRNLFNGSMTDFTAFLGRS